MSDKPYSSVMRAIERRTDRTLPAVITSDTTASIAYRLAQQGYAKFKAHRNARNTWTITVPGDDAFYFDAQRWVMSLEKTQDRHALSINTRFVYNPYGPDKQELRFLLDDEQVQEITLADGELVTVSLHNKDGRPDRGVDYQFGDSGSRDSAYSVATPKLVFTAKSRSARDALMAKLTELSDASAKEQRKPGIWQSGSRGNWTRRDDLPKRPLESVILRDGLLEELLADLRDFSNREADYVRRAIPYHRAYLLTGPPGTGKTSAVKAIAGDLGLDLWYAQLSGIEADIGLAGTIAEVKNRSVLLLEDIDSLPAACRRDETESGTSSIDGKKDISTSGLLNALDGVTTPHGLVTIMTTNHPEKLDPALLRPGRIDRTFAFTYPDTTVLHRHFTFFYGQPPTRMLDPQGRSNAAVSEIFKRHMDSPRDAELALLRAPASDEERDWHVPAPVRPDTPERLSRALAFNIIRDQGPF